MFNFFKKKKMTESQKKTIQISNCYRCGWRIPINNNPITCVWGIMDYHDIRACNGRAECDRYVSDIVLEKQMKLLLNTNRSSIKITHDSLCETETYKTEV